MHGKRPPSGISRLGRRALWERFGPNLGAAILRLPGVASTRRAASTIDPVIRGLGGERVLTSAGGVPLYGACPSRMDPPINYFGAEASTTLTLERGVPSVAHGPIGLGATLRISPYFLLPPKARPRSRAAVASFYDSARRGGGLGASVSGGDDTLALRVSGSATRLQSYRSGDDKKVPAGLQQAGAGVALGVRFAPGQTIEQAFLYRSENDVEYPALPMDNLQTELFFYSARYRAHFDDGWLLKRLELRAGLAHIDHLMGNRTKPNRAMMLATTPATSTSASAGIRFDFDLSSITTLSAGADFVRLARDATRSRTMVATGMTLKDHVWPDTKQLDVGLFAEHSWRITPNLDWRNGARTDFFKSSARGLDDASLGGKTVLEQYDAFYGGVDDPQRFELAASVLSLLHWRPTATLGLHVGAHYTMRPAGVTERYFAFGPAPGGYLVGNPTLNAEKKVHTELGVSLKSRFLDGRIDVFTSWVKDFILRQALDVDVDVDGDGNSDLVRGFSNVDALLFGAELALRIKPWRYLTIPLALSAVRGLNSTGDRDLPEIPPLMGRVAVQTRLGRRQQIWAELGLRFAAAQELIDEAFGEDTTDAWATLNASVGTALGRRWRLSLTAENLLDAEYHEHLTREAIFAAGSLQSGDEIPAPGRRVVIRLSGSI